MNDIQKRLLWETFDDVRPVIRPGGRMGTGAQNHCAHGINIVLEKDVDWHPFEHYTLDYPIGIRSQHLEPSSDGTQLNIYFKLKMPLPKCLRQTVAGLMFRMSKVDEQFNTLVRLIEEEAKNSGKVNDDQNRS